MPAAALQSAVRRAPIVRPRPRLVARPADPVAAPPSPDSLAPDLERLRTRCQGRTVFVLASGPSLTPADVAAVRATGAPVIVANTTFRLAPWADALFFQDRKWFVAHNSEVRKVFKGLACSGKPVSGPAASGQPVINLRHLGIDTYRNSGAGAIALAIAAGASRVVCLGLDCQAGPDGQRHWHGAHPPGLGNVVSLPLWAERIAPCAAFARQRGVPVLNASRATALTCFPRVSIESVLAEPELAHGMLLRPEDITVFTAVFGHTDPLHEPVGDIPCRMVCYTDQPNLVSQRWEILRLPPQAAPTRAARRIKALSHLYTDTPWSLWADASFVLAADPTTLAMYGEFVAFRHHERARISDEAAAIIKLGKARAEDIKAQLAAYQAAGFDTAAHPQRELSENGLILRHHTPEVIALNELWCQETQTRSLRDQMSLDYCAWRLGLPIARWPGTKHTSPIATYRHAKRPVNDF